MNSLDVPITIETDRQTIGDQIDNIHCVRNAVRTAARSQGFSDGSIGVLITDDETIHKINREYLDHDYPTDVISFAYSQSCPNVEGELVVSLDTAIREAAELHWPALHELLLYVVHGTLHICGLNDTTPEESLQMRMAEQQVLLELGVPNSSRFAPDAATTAVVSGQLDTHSEFN
jgi:probable rRNA maturation factor